MIEPWIPSHFIVPLQFGQRLLAEAVGFVISVIIPEVYLVR